LKGPDAFRALFLCLPACSAFLALAGKLSRSGTVNCLFVNFVSEKPGGSAACSLTPEQTLLFSR
jgi:hypothetical protein